MGVCKRVIGEGVIGGRSNRGVIVLEQAIREQGLGEQVIGKRENLGASDRGVLEKKNTVRNEREYVFFNTLSACHETL